MHSDSHKIVDQIQQRFPEILAQAAFPLDRAHVPMSGGLLIDSVHLDVRISQEVSFNVQVLKSYRSQLSIEKVRSFLLEIGVQGNVELSSYFSHDLDSSRQALSLPLSEHQAHLTILDQHLFSDDIELCILSGDDRSYSLSKSQLKSLYSVRSAICDVTYPMTMQNIGYMSHDSFETDVAVVDHTNASELKSSGEGKKNNSFMRFLSGRNWTEQLPITERGREELALLVDSCTNDENSTLEDFCSGLEDLLRFFPVLNIYILDAFYGAIDDTSDLAGASVVELVEIIGLENSYRICKELLANTRTVSSGSVQTLAFMHCSDLILIYDAITKLIQKLEMSGKLESICIDKAILLRLVHVRFYSYLTFYRILEDQELSEVLTHLLANRRFDFDSAISKMTGFDKESLVNTFMRNNNYPRMLVDCALNAGKGLAQQDHIQYEHVIYSVISLLEKKGNLRFSMAEAQSHISDYFLDVYEIRDEVVEAVNEAQCIQVFSKPALAKKMEIAKSKIDLSFYRVC